MENRKVVIIGDGMVGSSIAFSLFQDETVNELVIIDLNKNKTEGDILDLNHGMAFVSPKKLKAGDYSDIKDAHIVVITAGVAQKEGEDRLSLLQRNLKVYDSIIDSMKPYIDDEMIFLVVSNPVDILSYYLYKKLGIPSSRVIGSGTVLDTARLKFAIADKTGIDPRNVHTYVVGEHGDSEVAAYSVTTIGGIPISDYCQACGNCGDQENELLSLHRQVRQAAYDIISKKGATYYAVALAVRHIVKAILNDYSSILTVSTYIDSEFEGEIHDIYFSLPCVLSGKGIERVLRPNYSTKEVVKIIKSGKLIRNEIESFENKE